MSSLEEQIIDILTPFYGNNKSTNKLNKILGELGVNPGSLDGTKLNDVANKLEDSCKNLGPNTASAIKDKVSKLT